MLKEHAVAVRASYMGQMSTAPDWLARGPTAAPCALHRVASAGSKNEAAGFPHLVEMEVPRHLGRRLRLRLVLLSDKCSPIGCLLNENVRATLNASIKSIKSESKKSPQNGARSPPASHIHKHPVCLLRLLLAASTQQHVAGRIPRNGLWSAWSSLLVF